LTPQNIVDTPEIKRIGALVTGITLLAALAILASRTALASLATVDTWLAEPT
jgi:hypothetical protein